MNDELKSSGQVDELGFFGELKSVLLANKKIWLMPIVLTIGVITLAVFFGSTGEGSFIYSLF